MYLKSSLSMDTSNYDYNYAAELKMYFLYNLL